MLGIMKKITNLSKNYWIFILLAAVVAGLLVFRLSRRPVSELPIEPSPSPAFGALPQPQSRFNPLTGIGPAYNILFSKTSFTKMPNTLPVYKTRIFSKEDVLSYLNKAIVDLGFLGQPTEEEINEDLYLTWREEENYLSVNISSGQFSFVGKKPLIQDQTISPSQVSPLITDRLFSWRLISDKPRVKELAGFTEVAMELYPVSDINKATFFKIAFEPTFNNYPLVGTGLEKNLIEATLDNRGALVTLSFFLHQVNQEVVSYYPIKSYEEVIQEIEVGLAQIIETTTKDDEYTPIPQREQIQEVKLSSISIAYYETTEAQEFYQPIFLLKGTISLKEGETLQATFILPAISSEYLKPLQEHFKP